MDLLKILKAGDQVFSLIHGKFVKIKSIEPESEMPIEIPGFKLNRLGSVISGGSDCLICPSEEKRSWKDYSPFKKGDIVMAGNAIHVDCQVGYIGVYSHFKDGLHYLYGQNNAGELEYYSYENCEYFDVQRP